MVQLNVHDEFKIFAAFLIYRLESKQPQWCLLGTALRNQVQKMREIKAASSQKLILSSLLHLPLSCPHPRGSLVPCSYPSMVLFSFAPDRIPPKSFHTTVYLSICHLKSNIFREGFTATGKSQSDSCCFSTFSLLPIAINKFRPCKPMLIS